MLLLEQYKLYYTHTKVSFNRFVNSRFPIVIQNSAYQCRLPSTKITEKKNWSPPPSTPRPNPKEFLRVFVWNILVWLGIYGEEEVGVNPIGSSFAPYHVGRQWKLETTGNHRHQCIDDDSTGQIFHNRYIYCQLLKVK